MKLRNKKDGKVIDVPTDHAINVLLVQGSYEEVVSELAEEAEELVTVLESAERGVKKKPGRPKKVV